MPTGRAAGPTPLNALGDNVLTTTLDRVINWGRSSAIWPALFGLACCAIEMMGTVGPRHDLSRFGSELFRASPRQADLMIVSGRVSIKMAPVLRQIYDQIEKEHQKLGRASNVSFDQLRSMIEKQSETVRERYKVNAVAFRVDVVDGKVKLKAKPVQEK